MGKPREIRKRCCVCGTNKSKTWSTVKTCNACRDSCAKWLEEQGLDVCPWHKQVSNV